jgi:predicted transcriptional regulator
VDISDSTIEFLRTHFNSVTQLESLLLLRRFRERQWTAAEVSKEMYSTEDAVAEMLNQLARSGLVTATADSGAARYIYGPSNPRVDLEVQTIQQAYATQRVKVIDLIFSRPYGNLQRFADAFKIKRDEQP